VIVGVFASSKLELHRQLSMSPVIDGNYAMEQVPAEGQTIIIGDDKYVVQTVHIVAFPPRSVRMVTMPVAYIWVGGE
jgi:hypothetical protein